MNFRIVEGEDILDSIQDDFLQLYLVDKVKVADICKQLNISRSQFQNLRMRLVRRGVITTARNGNAGMKKERRYDPKQPKNYAFMRREKMFHIKRKGQYYGCFKKEKDAQRFVELMRECDWDKSRSKELKEKVLKE